jgi:hypothetical protein
VPPLHNSQAIILTFDTAWHILFDSLWKSFETRFDGILVRLSKHKELLFKEAVTIDIVEARQWRTRALEDLENREKKRDAIHLHDTLAWLNVHQQDEGDEFDRLLRKRQPGTCEWIFKRSEFESWAKEAHADRVLWVKGIPGAGTSRPISCVGNTHSPAGKTILTTYLIDKLQKQSQTTIGYLICNSYTKGKSLLAETMRSLAVQLLRANLDLMPYAFDNYANKGLPVSTAHLRRLLQELVVMIPEIRICVDGLDEYPEPDQRSILQDILPLTKVVGGNCRVLISSREVPSITRALKNKPSISLRDEESGVDEDIDNYVHDALQELRERFCENEAIIDEIQHEISAQADGPYAYTGWLEDAHSVQECFYGCDLFLMIYTDAIVSRSLDRRSRSCQVGWIRRLFVQLY